MGEGCWGWGEGVVGWVRGVLGGWSDGVGVG